VARELAIADELQHSLLPDVEPHIEALEIATFYRPGVEGTQVGGDWYDVIDLGGGRTAIVIGDVMGRGVRAASVMGQIKAAVRAFARLDLTPGEVVENLDGIVQDVAPLGIVTLVYGVYDDADRSLSFANAGHPPPILVDPEGGATRLKVDGPPLGSGYVGFETRRVDVPVGGLLTVYTDGLVERRGTDLAKRLDELEKTLVEHRDDPVSELPGTLVGLLAEGASDDVALAVVKVHDSGSEVMRLPLDEDLSAVATARRAVAAQLRAWEVSPRVVADMILLTSELVTNSQRHARGPYELRLRHVEHEVMVEAVDASPQRPRRRRVDGDAESGRGLTIVEAVADRWGSRSTPDGKVVWAARRL
jgi:anti-sigma regulatory factor (Ser/Thr protein kinase)